MKNISVFRLQSDDFEEMREALYSWDHEYNQIGSGPFAGSIVNAEIGSISIFSNQWNL